jgi:O-glycosyl hydrolase
MGESIASYILHMQQNSVPITFAEVQNEPDIQAGIQYPSPEALRDAGKVLLQMLDHYDLQSIQLHAPNLHSPSNNIRWIETWLEDETLRQRTAAVSYHTWWSEHRPDYEAIWQAAQKYNMPVWATEAGYSGSATSIDPKKWLTAFGFAESYYRAIAWSHASRVYHWSLLGFDGAVGKEGERYPMLYALKHFTNYIPAGSVLIESQVDDPQVFTLAFQRPDGMYSIILLNRLRAPRLVAIAGLTGEISQVVTSSDKAYEVTGTLADDGALTLPPLSITSIV